MKECKFPYECCPYQGMTENHEIECLSKDKCPISLASFVSDQTIKSDAGKPRPTLVPPQIIFDIARVREYGLKKYGDKESWKSVEVERYRDAMCRHLIAYLKNPNGEDEESKLPHLWHVATNVAFLCELEKDNEKE